MTDFDEKLIEASEIFKALSHPARLCIVNKLTHTNLNVTQMQDCLAMSQSNISQHLSILKSRGVIKGTRIGSEVIYSLTDERMRSLVSVFLQK
jgi:ArsR family transcriptional regulator